MPYPQDALEPFLSEKTVYYHRRKQERYVARVNELVSGTRLEGTRLPTIVDEAERALSAQDEELEWVRTLFEQSSQALNHAWMWQSMRPPGRTRRGVPVAAAHLLEDWRHEAGGVFGSGWVWLVRSLDGDLLVEATLDADQPRLGKPLLVMDVWEHAYYLDYPDSKSEYVDNWWHALADWSVLEAPR